MFDLITADPRPLPRRHAELSPVQFRSRKANQPLGPGEIGRGVQPAPRPTPEAPSLHLRTTPYGDTFTDAIVATEVYRCHTYPHLYDDWQRDLIDDGWLEIIGERYSHDCEKCHRAVITDNFGDPCPTCGTEWLS